MKYILIFEDGDITIVDELVTDEEDLLKACEDGVVEIINPITLEHYAGNGEWKCI